MELVEKYRQLFADSGKGTSEQLAYRWIIKALESSDPQAEIEQRICKACDAIERHDGEVWYGPRGYRGYYNRQIELYKQALGELYSPEDDEPSSEDRLERQAQTPQDAPELQHYETLFLGWEAEQAASDPGDEYDGYSPEEDADWLDELRGMF